MRDSVLAFWLGIAVAFVIFVAGSAATTFDADVRPTGDGVAFAQHVDGPISQLLAVGPSLGTLHVAKRSWGVFTEYTEDLTIAGARLAQATGAPASFRVSLTLPGTVASTNATGRDGRALVWTSLPADAPLTAAARATNWPAVVLLAAAALLPLALRARP
jgi:hypothetical protein